MKIYKKIKIGIIGAGYVGLPLAMQLQKYFDVICFDIKKERIKNLKKKKDVTNEINKKDLKKNKIFFSYDQSSLKECNFFIITVPTPITSKKLPDFRSLKSACQLVSKNLKDKDIIVFESTVYPGATEEKLIPWIEKFSKLKLNKNFYVGYSPERINPGDKKHTIDKIIKIVSASDKKSLKIIKFVYSKIIRAGLHVASSLKVAEAAKVIENIQRDTNIALINELSVIFKKMNLNTIEILKAAETKWNFLPFRPGLVGGHCIGVDPYYLTYKAKQLGINPKIILSGRNTNDQIPKIIVNRILKLFKKKKINKFNSKILILGATFKENVPDFRNSQSLMLYKILNEKISKKVDIYDPYNNKKIAFKNLNFIDRLNYNRYDCIILSVAHKYFKEFGIKKIKKLGKKNSILFDVKSLFDKKFSDDQL